MSFLFEMVNYYNVIYKTASDIKKQGSERNLRTLNSCDMAEWLGFEPRRGLTPLTI